MPTARNFMGTAVLDGLIYIVGGTNSDGITDDVEVYNPTSNNWSSAASLPEIRTDLALVGRKGKLYAFGGTIDWPNGEGKGTVFVYDPGSNIWSIAAQMPTPRLGCRSAVIDDIAYVIGGRDNMVVVSANEAFGFNFIFLPYLAKQS